MCADGITPLKTSVVRVDGVSRVKMESTGVPFETMDNHMYIHPQSVPRLISVLNSPPLQSIPSVLLDFVSRTVPPSIPIETIRDTLSASLWDALRPFQQTAVRFGVRRRRIMIADAMGSGKTLEALGIMKFFESEGPSLIVCPSILKHTWKSEIAHWLQSDNCFVAKSSKQLIKELKTQNTYQYWIVPYSLLTLNVDHLVGFVTIVLDESHYIKHATSQRTKAALALISKARNRILLSGTPFSYPSEMFTQIQALYPQLYPRFFVKPDPFNQIPNPNPSDFASRYCEPTLNMFGGNQYEFKGYQRREELHAILSQFVIRRRKEQLLPFLPPKNRVCITLPELTKSQYDEIAERMEKETRDKTDFMASFRLTCAYKRPHVLEFIKSYIIENMLQSDENAAVLIFCHHSETRSELENLMKTQSISFFTISGSTSDEKRAQYQDEFQRTDKYRVGILSINAAGCGLTLTRAHVVVFAEILFGPDAMLQAEDRVHRMGQEKHVTIYYLLSPKTTDEIVWRLLCKKEKGASHVLDGEPHALHYTRFAHDEEWTELNPKKRKSETMQPIRIVSKRMRAEQQVFQ